MAIRVGCSWLRSRCSLRLSWRGWGRGCCRFRRSFIQNRRDVLIRFTYYGNQLPEWSRFTLVNQNLSQNTVGERLHLHCRLIGINLREWLSHGDLVPFFLQPPRDLTLLHRWRELGH